MCFSFQVMVVCSVAYAAGVLTMVASTASVMYTREQLPPIQSFDLNLPTIADLSEPFFHFFPRSELQMLIGQDIKPIEAPEMEQNFFDEDTEMDNKTSNQANSSTKPKSEAVAPTKKRHQSKGLQLPGFITLVMLKDTVLGFASAICSKYSQNPAQEEVESKSSKPDMIMENDLEPTNPDLDPELDTDKFFCSCGCCDSNSDFKMKCYNLTTFLPEKHSQRKSRLIEHWKSSDWPDPRVKVGRSHGHNFGNSDQEKECDAKCACQCCCPLLTQAWNFPDSDPRNSRWTLLSMKVDEPFAGITWGYGTSSLAAAAG